MEYIEYLDAVDAESSNVVFDFFFFFKDDVFKTKFLLAACLCVG